MQTEINNTNDAGALIKRLFAAGAHFGFTKSRRHPTVLPYIFGSKQGTDIIDLEKTSELLETAKGVLREAGKNGKTVLFVGTKEEVGPIVKGFAVTAEAPFVVNRWIGGMLTNFSEIRKRVARLHDLVGQGESGELERKYTKKERVVIGRELEKLHFNFDGIKDMSGVPQIMVVVDPRHDSIAVREARDMGLTIIALTSSDADLRGITHPIIANDALQASVSLILDELTNEYVAGKKDFVPVKREDTRRRG